MPRRRHAGRMFGPQNSASRVSLAGIVTALLLPAGTIRKGQNEDKSGSAKKATTSRGVNAGFGLRLSGLDGFAGLASRLDRARLPPAGTPTRSRHPASPQRSGQPLHIHPTRMNPAAPNCLDRRARPGRPQANTTFPGRGFARAGTPGPLANRPPPCPIADPHRVGDTKRMPGACQGDGTYPSDRNHTSAGNPRPVLAQLSLESGRRILPALKGRNSG